MKVYLDLVFFVNLFIDYLLLSTVNIVLKRRRKWHNILLGSMVGTITMFFLFIKIPNILLFLLKIIISLIMIRVTFGKTNIKTLLINEFVFYFISIVLGGFLYYFKIEISYKKLGLIFYTTTNTSILLLLLTPFFLYIYRKQIKLFKTNYHSYHTIEFKYRNKKYVYTGFLDTGNHLYDPYRHQPVIILYDPNFKLKEEKILYVPYEGLNNKGLLPCTKIKNIKIDNQELKKELLLGLSKEPFHLDGINLILHSDIF
ncbi:MAG: hypothetical protein E7168_04600 [Firmicutes bacterium]|nr:hypothetical protein [Bacillota bacterium]